MTIWPHLREPKVRPWPRCPSPPAAASGWEAQKAAFFRFRERPIVVEELRGGICILGRRSHLGGRLGAKRAAFFILRERLVVFDDLKGGTCILGRRFHLVGSSKDGAF